MIKKVKLLKKPKFDLTKLMELYSEKVVVDSKADKVEAKEEPKNKLNEKKEK
jgi:hypothetical protein